MYFAMFGLLLVVLPGIFVWLFFSSRRRAGFVFDRQVEDLVVRGSAAFYRRAPAGFSTTTHC